MDAYGTYKPISFQIVVKCIVFKEAVSFRIQEEVLGYFSRVLKNEVTMVGLQKGEEGRNRMLFLLYLGKIYVHQPLNYHILATITFSTNPFQPIILKYYS